MLVFGLGSPFIATHLSAQRNAAVAVVPFAFSVSGHMLPAGTYHISKLNPVALQGSAGGLMTKMCQVEAGNPTHPAITFARSGDQWVLVKITPPDSSLAYLLRDTSMENTHLGMATLVSVKLK